MYLKQSSYNKGKGAVIPTNVLSFTYGIWRPRRHRRHTEVEPRGTRLTAIILENSVSSRYLVRPIWQGDRGKIITWNVALSEEYRPNPVERQFNSDKKREGMTEAKRGERVLLRVISARFAIFFLNHSDCLACSNSIAPFKCAIILPNTFNRLSYPLSG